MMADTKRRIQWIDLVRVIAILCVILCHATERIYQLQLGYIDTYSIKSQIIAFAFFTIGRLGVSLFFLISGYLLLDREYSAEDCKRFWKTSCFQLWVCTVVWWIIYDLYLSFQGQEITLKTVLMDILFFHKVNMSHVWYMPVILSLYLLIPLVANALKRLDNRYLMIPISFFVIYMFGFPFCI